MKAARISALSVCAAIFLSPIVANAGQSFIAVPYTGGDGSFGRGVSADGSVVIGTAGFGAGHFWGFRWDVAQGAAGFALMPPGVAFPYDSTATAVSADGRYTVGLGEIAPYIYDAVTDVRTTIPGVSYSNSISISADGKTVVGGRTGNEPVSAWKWTESGGVEFLPGFPSANLASANGSVIGGQIANIKGAVYSSAGLVELDRAGYSFSLVNGISADGSKLAGQVGPSNNEYFWSDQYYGAFGRAALWGLDGSLQFLAADETGKFSEADGMSPDGNLIVGTMGTEFQASTRQAMMWTEQTGMISLQSYLLAQGFTGFENWTLRQAFAVSGGPDGYNIVGYGVHEGIQQGFLVTGVTLGADVAAVPEPATIGTLGMALVVTLVARRRVRTQSR